MFLQNNDDKMDQIKQDVKSIYDSIEKHLTGLYTLAVTGWAPGALLLLLGN